MRRIKLTLDYNGSAYSGWQRQPGRDTVQSRLEDALYRLTGESITAVASGRTDAGVHALGQVAHFDTEANYPVRNFVTGLNRFLPPDIRVQAAEEAPLSFHARFSAHEKTYRYVVYEGKTDRALSYGREVRIAPGADVAAMREAAKIFRGKHDFASFCASGADTTTSVRTIKRVSVVKRGERIIFSFTADGFLYNMVRRMVAEILRVGEGKATAEDLSAMLAAADKNAVRHCMPPEGLYLVSVKYGKNE